MTTKQNELIDFLITDHGSICILTARTDAAREWTAEHLPNDRQMFGECGSVIESRYIGDIVSGILDDDLVISG